VYVVDVDEGTHWGNLRFVKKRRHRQADIGEVRSPATDRMRLAIKMEPETAAFGYLRVAGSDLWLSATRAV
jgi:hypothetical protein